MSTLQIVRAWKDEAYRNSLTQAQRDQLPAHPAGTIEFVRGAVAAKTNGSKCGTPVPDTMWCTWCCGGTYSSVGKALGSTCA